MSKTDDVFAQILQDTETAAPFIRKYGIEAWSRLKSIVGRENAFELITKERNDIMVILRIEYGLSSSNVGEMLGISGARVRQLTPLGMWHRDSEAVHWDKIMERVIKLAIWSKLAWSGQGKIKREWILSKFGEDVARRLPDIHDRINKLEMILLYREGLANREECLSWLNRKYFREGHTFRSIAKILSEHVPISVMCVHRNAQAMGFKGYTRGRRFDLELD